jgi:hypothetical protein
VSNSQTARQEAWKVARQRTSGKCFSSGRRDSASCNNAASSSVAGPLTDAAEAAPQLHAISPSQPVAPPLAPFRGWRCLITSLIASLSGEVLLLGNETCECHCQPRRPLTPAPPSHIAHPSPRALCNRAPPCKLRSTYSFTSVRHRRESLNALTLHY